MIGDHMMRYISRMQLEASGLTGMDFVPALEEAFRLHAEGRCTMPAPIYFHRQQSQFCNALVTWMPDWGYTSGKIQLGDPANVQAGRPQVQGLLVLFDDRANLPLSIMEAGWVTALRSVGVSAVMAARLAPSEPRVLGIIGAGLQGRLHLETLEAMFPQLTHCRAFDTAPVQAEAFRGWAAKHSRLEVEIVDHAQAAATDADILVTATVITKTRRPTIEMDWIGDDCLVLALDRDCCFADAALAGMDTYVSDDRAYFEHAQTHEGSFELVPRLDLDVAELLVREPVRASRCGRTLALPIGVPIADMAGAVTVWRHLGSAPDSMQLPF